MANVMKVRLAKDLPLPAFERFVGRGEHVGTAQADGGFSWWAWAAFPWVQLRVRIAVDGAWSMWAGYPGDRATWRLRVKGVPELPANWPSARPAPRKWMREAALREVEGALYGDAVVGGGVFPSLPRLAFPKLSYEEQGVINDRRRDANRRADERARLQQIADTAEGHYPELLTEWPMSKTATPGRPRRVIHDDGTIEHRTEERPAWGRKHHLRYFLGGEAVAGLTLTAKRPRRGQSAIIDIVWTAPAHRRQGYAAALLEHARGYFRVVKHSRELTQAGAKWKRGVGNRVKQLGYEELQPWMHTPAVQLSRQDLQDSVGHVTARSVRRDYAPRTGRHAVYAAYVDFSDLPTPRLAENEAHDDAYDDDEDDYDHDYDDDFGGFDWSEIQRGGTYPPAKVLVDADGEVHILDGNHRLTAWDASGYNAALMWVVHAKGAP